MKRRVFYSNNSVLSDFTVNMQNYHSGTNAFSFVADEDCFYIGARLPFNHLYFKLDGTNVNANASAMTVSYWGGSAWKDAVEVIDETSTSGVSLAKSGFVTWVPDKSYGWIKEDTNYGGSSITGLTTVEIYNLYWLKITFSADLTADTALSWVGQKFSDDNDLGSEYSDLVRLSMLAAFETGKTTWEEQHVRAAGLIVKELMANSTIIEKEQILEREDFKYASVSKCAEIIYGGLGDDYKDDKKLAKDEYAIRINSAMPKIDKDANARFDDYETPTQGRLVRI